jgi:NAD(P)-dependent dehydrogenase (short-subunit alcohol dehydrogenase family)
MAVALITGGSRGFGLEVAKDLAGAGWQVVVDGRDEEVLAAAATAIGPSARAIAGSITDAGHRASLVAATAALGGLDLVVLNAGTLGPSPLPRVADIDLDALDDVFAVNAVAQVGLVQAALPQLRASGGTVVAVTSDAAAEAYEGWGGYGASKAALEHLAAVLAEEEPSITVHRLDPGDMRTEMHQAAFPGEDISDRPLPSTSAPAVRRLVEAHRPSGRVRAAELLEGAAP